MGWRLDQGCKVTVLFLPWASFTAPGVSEISLMRKVRITLAGSFRIREPRLPGPFLRNRMIWAGGRHTKYNKVHGRQSVARNHNIPLFAAPWKADLQTAVQPQNRPCKRRILLFSGLEGSRKYPRWIATRGLFSK
jgi:hypothetical protein